MLLSIVMAAALTAPAAPSPTPTPSPQRVLGFIRARFRTHRPPPPFVTYTMERKQLDDHGFPDYVGSYTYHIWTRSVDRAALARRVFRDYARGDLEFQRPAFNEDRDPGPPTADLFEPAPAHPHPLDFVPTPEAAGTAPPLIGSVQALGEFDYTVTMLATEGSELHLKLEPVRDPDRNRLREIWADKDTYELHKLVATDKLFVDKDVYPVLFTITMGTLVGHPVVTTIHGIVGGGYGGDGKEVDFTFRDIAFPPTLPDWYFDARSYAGHKLDAPS